MLKSILPGLLLSCVASGTFAATAPEPLQVQTAATTDQIIVKLRPSVQNSLMATPRMLVENAIDAVGLGIEADYVRPIADNTHVIRLPAPMTMQEASDYATVLSVDPAVEYAEPDQWMYPTVDVTPNDPGFSNQWEHHSPATYPGASNLTAAWGETTGSANVVVAIVDTGVLNHSDLAPRLIGGNAALAGYDFVNHYAIGNDGDGRDSDPSDTGDWVSAEDASNNSLFSGCSPRNSSWHGTHVAGTIGAIGNNALGISGVDWNARLLIARSMGKCGGFLSDITDAIRWSAGETVNGISNPNPANIINLSLGGYGTCGPSYQEAINAATARGAVVVTAAGNSNADVSLHRPANCANVVTVTALEQDGRRASFANSGTQVDIAAPGISILSTLDGGTTIPLHDNAYAYYKGTSMAAPHVSGVLALMLAANPHLTDGSIPASALPTLLENKLKASARTFVTGTGRDCTTSICGAGALDAYRAVMSVKTPPVANAGANQTVQAGAGVTLHGSGTDNSSAGEIIRYRWEQTAGTPVSLSDRSSPTPLFVAPADAGILAFRLTVTNNVGLTSTRYTNVTVEAASTSVPACINALAIGANSNAQWNPNCLSRHRNDRYASYYTFTLTQPASITADLTSSQDTYLFLLQDNGMEGLVLAYNDDSNGTTNSRIERYLPAGTYTLEATTYYAKREGSFNIRLSAAAASNEASCAINSIRSGQQLSGQWSNHCLSIHRGNNYYAGFYTFTLNAPATVSIRLDSAQQDTYLYLLAGGNSSGRVLAFNDDSNGTTNSRIERALPAGTYTLETTTYAAARTGSFTLNLATTNSTANCTPTNLPTGQTSNGEWISACTSTQRGSSFYATYYTFTLNAETAMAIDLQSTEQDTFLYLLEGNTANGTVIAFNDDSNGTTNSQITRTLRAGTYTLEATTYRTARTGRFTIRARSN